MKEGIVFLGIEDVPFNKTSDTKTGIIGAIVKGGLDLEGVISDIITVNGDDATDTMIEMINKCKYKNTIRGVMLKGVGIAGFNLVDIEKLSQGIGLPVIVIMRKRPEADHMKNHMISLGMHNKIFALDKLGSIHHYEHTYYQKYGIEENEVKEILKLTCTVSEVMPEPLRLAKIIASGLPPIQQR